MVLESLIGFLAPKITQYLFSHLKEWAEPIAKGMSAHLINFASEAYTDKRQEIEDWVRTIVPGERFDEIAVKATQKVIQFAMKELAEFIEGEIKLHGLDESQVLNMPVDSTHRTDFSKVFEYISSKVVKETIASFVDATANF